MPRITFSGRLAAKRKEYESKYDLADLKSGNDRANLELLLNLELKLEDKLEELQEDDVSVTALLKDIDTITETKLKLEKSLGIDRISRKKELNSENPAEYIVKLKQAAKDFLEQRLIKVYCKDCNILVIRFLPLTEHTKFKIEAQCSQCKKIIKIHREERDILFDLPARDREWRKRYPTTVIQSASDVTDELIDEDDDVIIGGE